MKRAKINYFIDVLMGISFLSVAATGIIKFPGFLKAFGVSRASLPMGNISLIHDWSGVLMTVLVLVHLIMHWNWIVKMTKSIFLKK